MSSTGFRTRGVALALAVGLLLVLAAPSLALAQSYSGGTSAGQSIDDQALAIENQLQCPVCENVTVAYSTSTLAGEMRQLIHQQLQQGWTRDQIMQYFVARYGEAILTQPPKHGLNLLVWLLPVAGVLAGLGAMGSFLLSRRPIDPSVPIARLEPLNDEDERLLQQALQGAD